MHRRPVIANVSRQRYGVTRMSLECKNCGASFGDEPTPSSADHAPCPDCGSKLRLFKKEVSGSLSFRGGVRGVAYRESKSKWFARFRSEPSFYRRLGIWVQRLMSLNKKSDSYSETVTNPQTREVIHQCSEPLSEHTGHGSARPAKKEADV